MPTALYTLRGHSNKDLWAVRNKFLKMILKPLLRLRNVLVSTGYNNYNHIWLTALSDICDYS